MTVFARCSIEQLPKRMLWPQDKTQHLLKHTMHHTSMHPVPTAGAGDAAHLTAQTLYRPAHCGAAGTCCHPTNLWAASGGGGRHTAPSFPCPGTSPTLVLNTSRIIVRATSPLRLLRAQSLLLSPSSLKMRLVPECYGWHQETQLAAILGSPAVWPVRKLLGLFLVGKRM